MDEPIPDKPPAEPFDVVTAPDSPPNDPVDVTTIPDGPPWEPTDVQVTPDGPPWKPVDVVDEPDGPPADPFQVKTQGDPPPWSPKQVPTVADHPPAPPVDVPTTPDRPPWDPSQVPTTQDPPPWDPVDVPTVNDGPPAAPVQVPTVQDPPPWQPTNPPIVLDPAKVQPDPVGQDFPPFEPPPDPTYESIANAVAAYDARLAAYLRSLTHLDIPTVTQAGAGALDPRVLGDWFKLYIDTVGIGGMTEFMAEQAGLYAMNDEVAQIFNPAYFVQMLVPYSMGHAKTTLDVIDGITGETVARAKDDLNASKIRAQAVIPGHRNDVYDQTRMQTDSQEMSLDTMVQAVLDDQPYEFLRTSDDLTVAGTQVRRFNASAYFEDRKVDGSMPPRATTSLRKENLYAREPKLAKSAFIDGVVRVPIEGESDDGSVMTTSQDAREAIDDDDARVPLSFTDLRVNPLIDPLDPKSKRYRTVYFRPFNLNINESLAPEWNETTAFGRTDPTVTYVRTTRSYNVSFEVVVFAPEDLKVAYQKMTWLKSLVYPSYTPDGLMTSGPVLRMRVGDLVSTESGGLPGVIRSLSFDWADALWELKKGFKVPRSYQVSLEFLALHDGPVGTMNGQFGVLRIPTSGQSTGDTTSADSLDSQEQMTKASIVAAAYMNPLGSRR